MTKFEEGNVYGVTSAMTGRASKTNLRKAVKVTKNFVTFEWVNSQFPEPEKVKIRHTDNGDEYAIIFGGIISDSIYADNIIVEGK